MYDMKYPKNNHVGHRCIYIYGGFRSHGGTPKSAFLIGFSIEKKKHPTIGVSPFQETSIQVGHTT